ncbi:unnamed protein product [Symbiodinium natans]|uniref:Uncharacterized protein n=1 Tax=Symbiodinium natans TaxID=878477 RepID=A0A812SLG3_9DINO|nr:unnamed protein product [Symbiodinium natans]
MEHGPSLVQTAATAKFPGANEPPILHHKSTNLAIEVHTGHAPPGSYLHRELAAVQTNATHATRDGQTGGDDPDGAITYNIGSGGDVHATQLFTQFDGRETDTSSCLAFAPKNRRGQGISKFDWQVYNKDDFLQLEPWAVPCDNAWMKDNVNKWQGYSFYFGQKAVEKCVTVTFSMGMQPVVAFVGGLQFEVLPKPLFELATTVCWPNKQPGGVDLSVLRSEIKSAGILLFSRTLRLSKRFGHNTDFSSGNIKDSYETWKSPAGIAKGESRAPMDTLRRTSFLQGNQTHQSQENEATETAKAKAEMAEEGLQWKAETEDLYLASVDYGEHMNTSVEKTFEAYGEEAARRMGASSGSDDFKFFRFKSPGMVSFEIEGLMSGNTLQLGMEMGFGPYQSPPKMIPLVDIGAQFALILAGLPFVSARSKLTAIEALKDFSMKDMGRAHGLPVRPDSVVALYNPHSGRYLKMSTNKLEPSPPMEKWGIPDSWGLERFTVVDAKKGQIALHSSAHNRFVGTGTVSPSRNVNDLPGDWASERFTVRDEGHGEVTLYNKHHSKCLKLWASGVGSSSTCGESSRFVLVPAERILTPGTMIALHSLKDNRFLKIDGERLTHSPTKDAVDLPSDWVSERFSVVDAGHGRIALHNAVHNRFVGRNKASPHRLPDQLPGDWHSEQFDVFPAGNGEITLRNRANWNTERLRVVHVKPYLEPGSTVALWCKAHGRYVKMGSGNPSSFLLARENHTGNETWPTPMLNRFRNALKTASRQMKHAGEQVVAKISGGRIFRSPERGSSGIPDDWVSERFTVVDAGNGQVAFHNSKYNRFLKMTHDGKMQVSPHLNVDALPSNWASERYTVVPAGGGQFAFHNSAHNRIIRMSGSEVDASPHRSPQDLPATWLWERFQVVPVKPYAPPGAIVALRCDRHGSYLAMTGTSLSRSSRTGADAIFTVVAAGNGQVAFHNSRHKRFVKMNGATMEVSPVRAADDLPASWTWERFTVIPAGLGEFALHNSAHNRIGTTEPPTHLEL